MKLNHDCVRAVLLFLEENLDCTGSIGIDNVELAGFDKNDVIYSLLKLHEAGYISGRFVKDISEDISGFVTEITWEGHKFLDTVRDNKVWKSTKTILSKVSSASISFVSSVASQVLSTLISQYMGLNQPLSPF